jgi:hypothetical protein
MKIRILIPALLTLLGAASCSEDFDVMAPYKPITVVYGLLDPTDTANYIRIQKAFSDPNASALDLAKLPDSSYFQNLTVTLQQITDAGQAAGSAEQLQRVDMASEGYPKAQGTFFTTPSYAYKSKMALAPGGRYRLLIRHNDDNTTDTADTYLVDPTGTNSGSFIINQFYADSQKVTLTPTSATQSSKDGIFSYYVQKFPSDSASRFVEAVFRFRYVDVQGGVQTRKYYDYTFDGTSRSSVRSSWLGTGAKQQLGTRYNDFYVNIGNALGVPPAGVTRLIDSSADFIAYVGSDELYRFQQNQRATGGLSGDQIQYRYTNIRGKNVMGILASRGKKVRLRVPYKMETLDELMKNPGTQKCGFTGVSTF